MKTATFVFLFALISSIAYCGTVILTQNDPVLTVRQSNLLNLVDVKVQNPVVFQYGTVFVPKELWLLGLHGIAYRQLTYLYPTYKVFPIRGCSYTVYGPSRIYTFELLNSSGQTIKLFSSVQNNEEATGEQTQEVVTQEAKAQLIAKDANKDQEVDDEHSGFSVIKLSRAYEIPRVALAIKYITRSYWTQIKSAPLVRCLQRWERGTYSFRLFFNGVPRWFEYTHLSSFKSKSEQLESTKSNIRKVSDFYDSQIELSVDSSRDQEYLPRQEPIFTVKGTNGYDIYTLVNFKRHAGYSALWERLNEHFGRFDQKWIQKIQYKVDSDVHYFQFQVKFVPFLVDIDLEAHYYGSTRKASLLQIDEKVFGDSKYVGVWSEIKDFNSYRAFREANEYVLSQFTYLRLYTVTTAYSSLYKNGRYVRLVYELNNKALTGNGNNQFNILVYICDGKYYISREDFQATNTKSSPANDSASLFVKVADVRSHPSYTRIATFFTKNYLSFWNAHRVEEIRIKDGVHIIKFRNPSALTDDQFKHCVLSLSNNDIRILNHFDWKLVGESSVHWLKASKYITERYFNCVPLFINSKVTPYGRHFEFSFLDQKRVFTNAYLRYVDAEDLITVDEWQGIAYTVDFDEVALPTDPEEKLTQWIIDNHDDVVGVVELKASSKNAYQCVALSANNRWNFNVNWVRGQWVLVSRELVNDGYYFVTGYPSINVASCTGYLARLYPGSFNAGWLYGAIEVKNIGYFVYTRVVYRVGVYAYQGIVRTTHGVENSHSLISWDRIRQLRDRRDYGYGDLYDWSYGLNSRYFFDYVAQPVVIEKKVDVVIEKKIGLVVEVIDKNDLLCAFWDDGKCIACYGDYYADNAGRCRRVEDQCEFWQVSGLCSRCSYGWSVDSKGRCIAEVLIAKI